MNPRPRGRFANKEEAGEEEKYLESPQSKLCQVYSKVVHTDAVECPGKGRVGAARQLSAESRGAQQAVFRHTHGHTPTCMHSDTRANTLMHTHTQTHGQTLTYAHLHDTHACTHV